MANHRTHSIEFKRQVAQEFLAGETLHGLSKRHDICRNLIRVWVQKYEAGAFDEDVQTADLLHQCEARIAALERLVGKQALELEFLRGGPPTDSQVALRGCNPAGGVVSGFPCSTRIAPCSLGQSRQGAVLRFAPFGVTSAARGALPAAGRDEGMVAAVEPRDGQAAAATSARL